MPNPPNTKNSLLSRYNNYRGINLPNTNKYTEHDIKSSVLKVKETVGKYVGISVNGKINCNCNSPSTVSTTTDTTTTAAPHVTPPSFSGGNLLFTFPCWMTFGNGTCLCDYEFNAGGSMTATPTGTYNVTFRVRGLVELNPYYTLPGSYVQQYVQKDVGTYVDDPNYMNSYQFIVGSTVYALNYGSPTPTVVIDYLLTVPIPTGVVYQLLACSGDGGEARSMTSQIVPDDSITHPIQVTQPYVGQFIQMDIMYATLA